MCPGTATRVVPRDDIEMGVGEEGIARRRDLNICVVVENTRPSESFSRRSRSTRSARSTPLRPPRATRRSASRRPRRAPRRSRTRPPPPARSPSLRTRRASARGRTRKAFSSSLPGGFLLPARLRPGSGTRSATAWLCSARARDRPRRRARPGTETRRTASPPPRPAGARSARRTTPARPARPSTRRRPPNFRPAVAPARARRRASAWLGALVGDEDDVSVERRAELQRVVLQTQRRVEGHGERPASRAARPRRRRSKPLQSFSRDAPLRVSRSIPGISRSIRWISELDLP